MPSLCFHERIFSSEFWDNISLVGLSWRQKFIGQYKNIALKMQLSPGNKSGDSVNLYLQKSIVLWKPSFKELIAPGIVTIIVFLITRKTLERLYASLYTKKWFCRHNFLNQAIMPFKKVSFCACGNQDLLARCCLSQWYYFGF